jgi:hypothetical protein
VDQGYQFVLSRTGEGAALPIQRVEHDDEPGLHEPESLPVNAVRFFADVEPGAQTFTWWGIHEEGGTDVMTVEFPTLAVACTRARLGPDPFSGRAAVGGAHAAGPITVASTNETTLVSLDFSLKRPSTCAAFATASARNPGGGTLGNVYRFRVTAEMETFGWDTLLEFDDNAGVDDLGLLPIAHTHTFDLERGEQTLRFVALKDEVGDADLDVSSASWASLRDEAARAAQVAPPARLGLALRLAAAHDAAARSGPDVSVTTVAVLPAVALGVDHDQSSCGESREGRVRVECRQAQPSRSTCAPGSHASRLAEAARPDPAQPAGGSLAVLRSTARRVDGRPVRQRQRALAARRAGETRRRARGPAVLQRRAAGRCRERG